MSENTQSEDEEKETEIESEIGIRLFFSQIKKENKKRIKINDFPESI